MKKYFSKFGKVKNAYLIYNPKSGQRSCFGYVEFETKELAFKALKSKRHVFKQSVIVSTPYRSKYDEKKDAKQFSHAHKAHKGGKRNQFSQNKHKKAKKS